MRGKITKGVRRITNGSTSCDRKDQIFPLSRRNNNFNLSMTGHCDFEPIFSQHHNWSIASEIMSKDHYFGGTTWWYLQGRYQRINNGDEIREKTIIWSLLIEGKCVVLIASLDHN